MLSKRRGLDDSKEKTLLERVVSKAFCRILDPERSIFAGPMSTQLTESVTAVVGLREAITSEYRVIRFIWTALFVIGIGATMFYLSDTLQEFIAGPTATSVIAVVGADGALASMFALFRSI